MPRTGYINVMFVDHTIAGRGYMTEENIHSVALSDRHVIYKVMNHDKEERGYIEFCDSTYNTIRATEVISYERIEETYLSYPPPDSPEYPPQEPSAYQTSEYSEPESPAWPPPESSTYQTSEYSPPELFVYQTSEYSQPESPACPPPESSTYQTSEYSQPVTRVPTTNGGGEVHQDACLDEEVLCRALDQIEKKEYNRVKCLNELEKNKSYNVVLSEEASNEPNVIVLDGVGRCEDGPGRRGSASISGGGFLRRPSFLTSNIGGGGDKRLLEVIPLTACSVAPTAPPTRRPSWALACLSDQSRDLEQQSTAAASCHRLSIQEHAKKSRKKRTPRYNSVSKIDRTSRVVFPLCFMGINLFYWYSYLSRSQRIYHAHADTS
uniref:Uncharacterized protein n=1 Tax=Timema tahoe TaxID=61484 RepID=A0A7R9IF06_9NEOP|nr:unnamed protein product [Timema tahoe]